MKVLLVGAGACGSVIFRLLARSRSVSEIVCGTNDLKGAREFLPRHRKLRLKRLDASDPEAVARLAKGCDLVINAASPRLNRPVMEACLRAGAHYQDLCSQLADLRNAEQLRFHERFRRAGLVGLINTGVSPGVSNLLAREAADRLDEVSDIKIRLVEDQKSSELIFAWSPEVALDQFTSPPLVYRHGRFQLSRPFADGEEYEFLHPFGRRHVTSIYGDEVATLPRYIRARRVDVKSCGTDIEFSKALYRLGLFDKRAIRLNGKRVVPLEFFSEIAPQVPTPRQMMELIGSGVIQNAALQLCVEVVGRDSGKPIRIKSTAVFPDLKRISRRFPGATYVSYPAGVSAVAFSRALPSVKARGVFPPEALGPRVRKEILLDLESSGIVVNEQYSKV